jgi:anti-sigma factor RsiW
MPTPEERIVAGLSCSDVLTHLSELIDDEIDAETRQRVIEHVQGCNWCEEFGGRFSAIVTALRNRSAAEPLDADVVKRLREHLNRVIGR